MNNAPNSKAREDILKAATILTQEVRDNQRHVALQLAVAISEYQKWQADASALSCRLRELQIEWENSFNTFSVNDIVEDENGVRYRITGVSGVPRAPVFAQYDYELERNKGSRQMLPDVVLQTYEEPDVCSTPLNIVYYGIRLTKALAPSVKSESRIYAKELKLYQ